MLKIWKIPIGIFLLKVKHEYMSKEGVIGGEISPSPRSHFLFSNIYKPTMYSFAQPLVKINFFYS